jgi:hypothetical protein
LYKYECTVPASVINTTEVIISPSQKFYFFFLRDDRDEAKDAPSNVAQKDVKMASLVEAEVIEIGTVKPDQDFKTLLERGEDFNKGMCSHHPINA